MNRFLISACCLAVLCCGHPDLDGFSDPTRASTSRPRSKSDRQVRNEALQRSLHEFNTYLDNLKTVGLVAPDVLVYELTAGGVGEIIEEWSEQASGQFQDSVARELRTRNISVKTATVAGHEEGRSANVKYLYRAISENLSWNTTYRKAVCPDVQVCPDFCLGPVDFLFKDPQVEALLLVLAQGDVPASEPPARQPEANASERIATVPEHEAPRYPSRKKSNRNYAMINGTVFATGTYVSMALVDRQGNVLWYASKATRKGADLRTRESVDEMTKLVLSLLHAKEKK